MITTQKIKLDFAQRGLRQQVYAVQGDSESRCLEISLYDSGAAWPVPDGVSVRMRYRLPDGTGDAYDTLPDGSAFWSASANVLTVMLAPQMLVIPGLVDAQIEFSSAEEAVATFSFSVIVEADPSAGVPEAEEKILWANWTQQELERMKESGEFDGNPGVYVLAEGETLADAPGDVDVVIDPDGESDLSSGDFVTAPATATVGQTIVVKAVDADGKPTQWEAKDLPTAPDLTEYYTKTEIDAIMGSYIGDIDALVGGDA